MKIGNIHNHLFSLVHIFIKNQKDVLTFVSKCTNWNLIANHFESLYLYTHVYMSFYLHVK